MFELVALDDGRALAIGGLNGAYSGSPYDGERDDLQSYSSAYLYDAATEQWTKTGLMTVARTAPSAVVLPDGRVLVVGGYFHTGFEESAAASLIDTDIALTAYRPEATARPRSSGPPLDDADVPPFGYSFATTELFDPSTGTWTATGPMRYARVAPRMVTLTDGRVLVVGSTGSYETHTPYEAAGSAEVYDPRTGRFEYLGPLPDADRAAVRSQGLELPEGAGSQGGDGTLVALPDGGALLVGNGLSWKHQADVTRVLRFDARTGTWSDAGDPWATVRDFSSDEWPTTPGVRRNGGFVAALADGRVLVAGSELLSEDSDAQWAGGLIATAELFDPVTGDWIQLPDLPEGRAGGSAVRLGDGSILLIGGHTYDGFARTAIRMVP